MKAYANLSKVKASIANGQRKQAIEQIKRMSVADRYAMFEVACHCEGHNRYNLAYLAKLIITKE